MDLKVWDCIAAKCLEWKDPLVAAAILLQGDTYLRPHEILNIKAASIIKPRKSRSRCWGIVVGDRDFAEPTKTKLYDDCVLLDSPGREDLGCILKYLLHQSR